MLRKDTGPVLPVRVHDDAAGRVILSHDASAHRGHRSSTLRDDARIARVKTDPQSIHVAPVVREAAVAEVKAEQVGVLRTIELGTPAGRTAAIGRQSQWPAA